MSGLGEIVVLFDTTHLELQYPIHFSNSHSSQICLCSLYFLHMTYFFLSSSAASPLQQQHKLPKSEEEKNQKRFMMNWCYDSLVCGNNANASFKSSHISLFAIITFYHCYNYLTLTNIWWCRWWSHVACDAII